MIDTFPARTKEIIHSITQNSRSSHSIGRSPDLSPLVRSAHGMIFSPISNIAFAHYPKTGGSSLLTWFRNECPDAAYVEADVYHMPVRTSLERLGLVTGLHNRHKLLRETFRVFKNLGLGDLDKPEPCDLRIIGVVREPFEMLVSLYEYWQRCNFHEEPSSLFIQAARVGRFREFLELAVIGQELPNYEKYFDVGGPAWRTTRLLDFASLESALAVVCREFGIQEPAHIERHNVAPGRLQPIKNYAVEAGNLLDETRKYYRWYYEEAGHVVVRGDHAPLFRAA